MIILIKEYFAYIFASLQYLKIFTIIYYTRIHTSLPFNKIKYKFRVSTIFNTISYCTMFSLNSWSIWKNLIKYRSFKPEVHNQHFLVVVSLTFFVWRLIIELYCHLEKFLLSYSLRYRSIPAKFQVSNTWGLCCALICSVG